MRSTFMAVLAFAFMGKMPAQSVTGQISGTVTDQGGSVTAGSSVRLTHDLSKQARSFSTDGSGNFLCTNLVPGDYSVHIEHAGFKGYDQRESASAPKNVWRCMRSVSPLVKFQARLKWLAVSRLTSPANPLLP